MFSFNTPRVFASATQKVFPDDSGSRQSRPPCKTLGLVLKTKIDARLDAFVSTFCSCLVDVDCKMYMGCCLQDGLLDLDYYETAGCRWRCMETKRGQDIARKGYTYLFTTHSSAWVGRVVCVGRQGGPLFKVLSEPRAAVSIT